MKKLSIKKRKERRRNTIVYLVLRIFVIASLVFQLINRNYNNAFLCILTLVLFMIPTFVDKKLHIDLPNALEIIILLFIFSAEILGEVSNFYNTFPHWDTLLHTINGFLMAAIGLSLIDILNENEVFNISLTPLFVSLVAFCFSMTVGVCWEFFEYAADKLVSTDMQKDRIVTKISSIELNPHKENVAVVIDNITKTTIEGTINNQKETVVIDNGYLDIGVNDTMKDLFVNCIGAVIFAVFGWFYLKGRPAKVVKNLLPKRKINIKTESAWI